jgi:hypothetical protein
MATVQRYINTASAGGNGTTNGTAGATAAYASLSSWEANTGAANLATDDHIVDCCGTAADTTGVTLDFAVNITSGSITIRGNRGDAAGFYDGNALISTSHYRLAVGNVQICLTWAETNITIDGIQLEHGRSAASNFASAILPASSSAFTVRNNRVRNTSSTYYGIGTSAVLSGSETRNIENNLVVGFNEHGINCRTGQFHGPTWNVLHNTVYGDGSSDGIYLHSVAGASSLVTNVKGNAIANSGARADINTSTNAAGTTNFADNATEQFDLGTTGEIDIGLPADAWTSPGTAQSSDFSVKNTSSALYQVVNPTLLTEDITEYTRDGTNHDAGCFELVVAAGTTGPLVGFGRLGNGGSLVGGRLVQ